MQKKYKVCVLFINQDIYACSIYAIPSFMLLARNRDRSDPSTNCFSALSTTDLSSVMRLCYIHRQYYRYHLNILILSLSIFQILRSQSGENVLPFSWIIISEKFLSSWLLGKRLRVIDTRRPQKVCGNSSACRLKVKTREHMKIQNI